jgi:transposase
MSKTFRPWKINEPLFLPPTVQDFVAKDHLARFVLSVVMEEVDLAKITGTYGSERGQPPFDPAMMTTLLLYAYCSGIYSSRRIAKACRERVDFMSIVGLDAPDFRTISDFRKRHLKALAELFEQVLHLCAKAGLAKLGHVGLDGTKIKANASKHKAMSYGRMAERATELEAEVAGWLSAAEAADGEEDKLYGRYKTGAELPDWVADKQRRAAKIRQAKGPSRELVFDQAARFFRVIAKDRRALVIAATLMSPGRGCRDGWTITVNADVSFAPTALGADCPISSIIGQPCDELSDTAADG